MTIENIKELVEVLYSAHLAITRDKDPISERELLYLTSCLDEQIEAFPETRDNLVAIQCEISAVYQSRFSSRDFLKELYRYQKNKIATKRTK